MAKENKSTTILLLVVAGALLFLVGSFTGQAFTWRSRAEGQSCQYDLYCQLGLKCINSVCTKITNKINSTKSTTGLTDNQRTEVLSLIKNEISKGITSGGNLRSAILEMLREECVPTAMQITTQGLSNPTCKSQCDREGKTCILGYTHSTGTEILSDRFITCYEEVVNNVEGKLVATSCVCCPY